MNGIFRSDSDANNGTWGGLQSEQIPEWDDTLGWAIEVMPVGYEQHAAII